MAEDKKIKRHKRDYWEAQITAWQRSGLSMNEYCQQNNLNPRSLTNWKVKLRHDDGKTDEPGFVEIRGGMTSGYDDNWKIEMAIGNLRLYMREGIDPLVMRDIALALGGL